MEIIGDSFGKWCAEHRDRRGEDEPRTIAIADGPNGFEQRARTVEIDAHPLLEVEFGFGGNHRGEMKDNVRSGADDATYCCRISDVGSDGLDRAAELFGPGRRAYIDKRKFVDRPAIKRAVIDQSR